jgi:molybdopterin-guanine dinucleotide biosynthesis protein A
VSVPLRAAGIVLAGGRSSRMGVPKTALEWHGSTLLRRTIGIVGRGVDGPRFVVRAPGQALPPLPSSVRVLEDPRKGLGPLQGLAVGLADAAADGVEVAFVCSTDLPFLHVAFVRCVLRGLHDGVDMAVPHARGHRQPLAAAYRTALAPRVEALLAAGHRSVTALLNECAVACLDEAALLADADLAAADPALDSVVNVNTPAEYAAARARPAPEVTVDAAGGSCAVRAATVAAAGAAVHVVLDGRTVANVSGDETTGDGETPLVSGDHVTFRLADSAT